MPVIVIGADTELGHAIVPALRPASGEIRLFASDADDVAKYRGFTKVAVGDISDGSHVGGAAIGAFCAIVITAAAHDERERHFAAGPPELFAQWADGLVDAGVSRVIVVGRPSPDWRPLSRVCADYLPIDISGKSLPEIATAVTAAEAAPPDRGDAAKDPG